MTIEKIRALRQALLDNAAGHPLDQVHRNNLFSALDELEQYHNSKMAEVPVRSFEQLGKLMAEGKLWPSPTIVREGIEE